MPPAPKTLKPEWQTPINFPQNLPISGRRDEIAAAIKRHQVIILAGETGSGKTTQLPKICLSLGYGRKGLIGHTQPRRIAARTVADRIASELSGKLGDAVGYQVRFNDVSGPNTRIKLMTDGILLAEIQRDKMLRGYEVIIIDEAHERSLNIDFLLGLLKPLCKKRPDLKIIITSATIDLNKFSEHFKIDGKAAPIIEVSGRTYPVETIYSPTDQNSADLADVITDTVADIIRQEAKGRFNTSGDILVFCAGEREIRETALALRRTNLAIEILPLYSRLSVAEQNKVFQKAHRRKVVLATNVAETSITVPGIAYVIDPGLARISRYSFRSKVQRLPIEPISQASANQRLGRCGRVANGVCIRLYSEQDFLARKEFTAAEILRSNLASVILKMHRLGLRNLERFDFIDRPDQRLLNDGYKLLQELNALDKDRKLTAYGRQMSDLPIDPKYARILIAAHEQGCLRDALIVISGLSIRDPRERPADKQGAADQAHRWLQHPQSEFFSYLNLWQAINNSREELSNSKFKQFCQQRYWSIARIFEWRELYRQLLTQCKSMGWKIEPWQLIALPIEGEKTKPAQKNQFSARYENLHLALISGLLGNVATKDLNETYLATRSRQVALFPGSPFSKRKPKWVLAAELMETSQLFMLTAAHINPDWIIKAARHLCRYSYSDPHYEKKNGAIRANRKTLFYGLTVRDKEAVNYGPINPKESHEIFLRQALIEGQYAPSSPVKALEDNAALIKEIEKIETKTRRRNLLVSDQILYDLYKEMIPQSVYSNASFEKWVSDPANSETLKLDREQLLSKQVDSGELAQFPDSLQVLDKTIHLKYRFDPSQSWDGVTMLVPISVLAPFPEHSGDWLVPGLLREKCIALIKTLPKAIRRNFAPAAQSIDRVMPRLVASNTPLCTALAQQLHQKMGVQVEASHFETEKLDPYYQMNYRVVDVDGSLVDEGRDLQQLKKDFSDAVQTSVHADHAPERKKLEQHNIATWTFGALSGTEQFQHQGMTITAYPMLKVIDDGSISLLLNDDKTNAAFNTQRAVLELAKKVLSKDNTSQSYTYLSKELFKKKHVNKSGLGGLATQLSTTMPALSEQQTWRQEVIMSALREACFAGKLSQIKTQADFENALTGAKHWVSIALELEASLLSSLQIRDSLFAQLQKSSPKSVEADLALEDIKAQLYRMFEANFLRYTTPQELKQFPRYLRAIESRLEVIEYKQAYSIDARKLQAVQAQFDARVEQFNESLEYVYLAQPLLKNFADLLQEWRVSIFAQHLRTRIPVSEKRLKNAWAKIEESEKSFT